MNFDMSIFGSLMTPAVVAACLVLGYILKAWIKDVDNKWIPTMLTLFGAVSACVGHMPEC